jgi:hypothetical protein
LQPNKARIKTTLLNPSTQFVPHLKMKHKNPAYYDTEYLVDKDFDAGIAADVQ